MNPLPPVEVFDDAESDVPATHIDIPVLEDPAPVAAGIARGSNKRRNAIFLGLALATVCATWLALNMPLENVIPENWQAEPKSITGQEPIAGNDS